MSFDYNNGRNGVWTGSDANRAGYHRHQAEEAARKRREEEERQRREREAARRRDDERRLQEQRRRDDERQLQEQRRAEAQRQSRMQQDRQNSSPSTFSPAPSGSNRPTKSSLPLSSPIRELPKIDIGFLSMLHHARAEMTERGYPKWTKPSKWDVSIAFLTRAGKALVAFTLSAAVIFVLYALITGDWTATELGTKLSPIFG